MTSPWTGWGLVLAGLAATGPAQAAEPKGEWIRLAAGDARGQAIARIFYADEVASDEGDEGTEVLTAWVKVAPNEDPYLFIQFTGRLCGNVNCPVEGLRNTAQGWRVVFHGNGAGWKMVETAHGG